MRCSEKERSWSVYTVTVSGDSYQKGEYRLLDI